MEVKGEFSILRILIITPQRIAFDFWKYCGQSHRDGCSWY